MGSVYSSVPNVHISHVQVEYVFFQFLRKKGRSLREAIANAWKFRWLGATAAKLSRHGLRYIYGVQGQKVSSIYVL